MTVLYNVGCKLNQYEGSCLVRCLQDSENIVIVNTCCVTREAEIKSLKKFRQAKRLFPDKKIIVTGCLAHLNPELFPDCEIIDNDRRNSLIKGIFPSPDKARYFLKIEDGCNQTCTYCVVSRIRKKVFSKPVAEIKKEIAWAKYLGFNEIVLVGANIGLYGIDTGTTLIELLGELSKIPELPRIRLSSLEPNFIDPEIISCLKDLPFCRHFHIPVQSGDDRILSLMGRQYDSHHIKNILELISKNFSDVAIGADIIVGFPEEKEEEFNNTLKLIQEFPFTHLHIFTYSPRPITDAYRFGDPVYSTEKKKRLWILKSLIAEKNFKFRQSLFNKILEVIIEKKENYIKGLSDNYIKVNIEGTCQEKELRKIRIVNVTKTETRGVLI
ncbi:MAG: MiaB/RimO family radical SAM methylthiotransferase [candidate division WOR-3 bacterium]|nr:MiaB/RimO family radical SAM methylthiotransferase [candidate division WOR-3 bacterium]